MSNQSSQGTTFIAEVDSIAGIAFIVRQLLGEGYEARHLTVALSREFSDDLPARPGDAEPDLDGVSFHACDCLKQMVVVVGITSDVLFTVAELNREVDRKVRELMQDTEQFVKDAMRNRDDVQAKALSRRRRLKAPWN